MFLKSSIKFNEDYNSKKLSGFHNGLIPFSDELSEKSEVDSESRYNEGGESDEEEKLRPSGDPVKFKLDISRESVGDVSSPIPDSLARFNHFRQLNMLKYSAPRLSPNNREPIEIDQTLPSFRSKNNESETRSCDMNDSSTKTDIMYKKLVNNERNYKKFKEKEKLKKEIVVLMKSSLDEEIQNKLNKHYNSVHFDHDPRKNGLIDEALLESDDDADHRDDKGIIEIDPIIQTREMREKKIRALIEDINKGLMFKMLNTSLAITRFSKSRIKHQKLLEKLNSIKIAEEALLILKQSKSKYRMGEIPPQCQRRYWLW